MHGTFGEDGEIQSFLEKHNIPFVGSGSQSCKKPLINLKPTNTFVHLILCPQSIVLKITDTEKEIKNKVQDFWKSQKDNSRHSKPASGGSVSGIFCR